MTEYEVRIICDLTIEAKNKKEAAQKAEALFQNSLISELDDMHTCIRGED